MPEQSSNQTVGKSDRSCDLRIGAVAHRVSSKIRRFWVCEDGPTAVEYAVMLALIVVVCLTAISAIGTKASSVFSKVANSM